MMRQNAQRESPTECKCVEEKYTDAVKLVATSPPTIKSEMYKPELRERQANEIVIGHRCLYLTIYCSMTQPQDNIEIN